MPPVTRPRASGMTLNERPSRKRTAIAKALPQRISPVESAPNVGDKSRRGGALLKIAGDGHDAPLQLVGQVVNVQISGTVACVVSVKPGMSPAPPMPGTDIDPTV